MLTVNIEDTSLKVTVIRGKRVTSAAEVPLGHGWVENGVVKDKAHVGQAISTLLSQNNIKEKECIACVSGIQSIYRVAYISRLDPAPIAEKVQQELERAIPVPLDSLYTSWMDLKMSDIETALCMVGLPFDNVNSVTETLRETGLQLKYLELKPLAISRVIDEKRAIVLNVQAAGFDLTIVNDGLAELIRSVPFPATAVSEEDRAALVKDEVVRTVNFYNSGHPNNPLDDQTFCILSGGLLERLSSMLGYRIKGAPGLLYYPQGQDANAFIANTGLAMRTINRLTRVDINVMPQAAGTQKREGSRSGTNILPLVVLAICAVAVLGMWLVNRSAEGETLKLQLQMNEKTKLLSDTQKALREKTDRDTKELAAYQLTVDTYSAPVKAMAENRASVNANIGAVIEPLPATMYLTSIAVNSGSISVEGSAPSEEILLNYARALRAGGRFKLVMINSVSNSSFVEVTFTMTLTTN